MKKFRFQSLIGISFIFLFSLNLGLIVAGLVTGNLKLIAAAIAVSVLQYILHDIFRRKHSIIKNYPLVARFKHFLAKISPAIPRLLFSHDSIRRGVTARQYQLIVDRARNVPTEIVRSSLSGADEPDYECLRYTYCHVHFPLKSDDLKVTFGTAQCEQPYQMSVLNIGALNQEMLKSSSILALSEGANIEGCAVNTGKGGISPALIRGGADLIWQIAHEDYALRKDNSTFNEELFRVTAARPYIKMIEVVLPRQDSAIRKRLTGTRLINFMAKLRSLSGGKPVGVRIFNPRKEIISSLCTSIAAAGIHLDFVTLDGSISANGFDAVNVSNALTPSYCEALSFLRTSLDGYGLPTRIIASGNIITEYDILKAVALGASACYSILPMIVALGPQSMFSVSQNNKLANAQVQRVRVANFHRNTLESMIKLMELCCYRSLEDVKLSDFYRKLSFFEVKSLKEIYSGDKMTKGPRLFSGLS